MRLPLDTRTLYALAEKCQGEQRGVTVARFQLSLCYYCVERVVNYITLAFKYQHAPLQNNEGSLVSFMSFCRRCITKRWSFTLLLNLLLKR
jgi:hypothetical protein